jgi:hypothetical protein
VANGTLHITSCQGFFSKLSRGFPFALFEQGMNGEPTFRQLGCRR